ncbi:alpha-tocopherol transfer protein-like [Malaya genurostris]|uniref:alpha-tocopherol transfer protein-like n=1 Tax=Malaya genurostris TaxID=325434 RepID=UPI0026F3B940|nr:alpha-tocopherol transfer protein-like [Malaya genurostris]
MTIKFNENNHPFVDLGGGFGICINRAAYEEDKQTRLRNDLPEDTVKALAEFRQLAESKRNLNLVVDQSNWTVMVYLKCYENDAKQSFALIDYGYRLLFKERDYSIPYAQIRHVFEEGLIRYLPECDDDGAVICVVEMGRRWNPSKISLNEFIAAIRLSGIATMLNPEAQKNGYRVIFDVEGLSMSHISHFTPKSSHFLFDLIENCTPIVIKGMHTVYNSMLYNVLWAILKPFMSKGMRQKTYMHGKDWNSLTKHINPRCLPSKYGGTLAAPDCDGKSMAEFLQLYEGYFAEYNSFGYTACPDS